MKRWMWVTALVIAAFFAYNRNRLYIRDPLGSVTRAGAKEAGAQVYINFSNDAFIENDNPPSYGFLVQHNNHVGSPLELHCMRWLVCMTDADAATLMRPLSPSVVEEMTGKSIRFIDSEKREAVITLR